MSVYQPTYPDGRGGRRKVKVWWAKVTVCGRTVRQSLKTRDRRAARALEAELVRKLEAEALGLVDPFERHRLRAVWEHVDEFLDSLQAKGRTAQHLREVRSALTKFLRWDGSRRLGDLDVAKASAWLSRETGRGVSARSVNKARGFLKQWSRWLLLERRLPHDLYASLGTLNVEADRRRVRRALEAHQVEALLKVAPRYREEAYRLAVTTGLRRGELRQLRWGDLDLEARTLEVRAEASKNGRAATLPLFERTASALRAWREHLSTKAKPSPTGPLDPVLPRGVPKVVTYRQDLKAAGIPYRDEEGEVCDFHALRATFGTSLVLAGVPLANAQLLLRHSNPALTARYYTRLRVRDLRVSVSQLAEVYQDSALWPILCPTPDTSVHFPALTAGSDGAQANQQKRRKAL